MHCFDRTVPSVRLSFLSRSWRRGGRRRTENGIIKGAFCWLRLIKGRRARPSLPPSLRPFEELLLSEPFNFLEGQRRHGGSEPRKGLRHCAVRADACRCVPPENEDLSSCLDP